MASSAHRTAQHPDPLFAVEVDARRNRIVLHGELDIQTAPLFDSAAAGLLGSGAQSAVVALGDLDFIDAAGLAAIVRLRNLLISSGRTLSIVDARPRIVKTFRCAGLAHLIG